MLIKNLKISNFKSFADLDINLNNLNILIGANASGKSNFVSILKFLKNITAHGLDNAISMAGGLEYLRNSHLQSSQDLAVSVTYSQPKRYRVARQSGKFGVIGIHIPQVNYQFSLHFYKRKNDFQIVEDSVAITYQFFQFQENKANRERMCLLGEGTVSFEVIKGKIKIKPDLPQDVSFALDDLLPVSFFARAQLPAKTLLLETPFFAIAQQPGVPLADIAIYDFDPRLPKRAVSITGKNELEEDGSNLTIVLKKILEDNTARENFLALLQRLLTFVDDVRVQKLAHKSLLFMLGENFDNKRAYLPAPFISDGTIHLMALIIALYFEDKPLILIEEPERNLHPHLIAGMVQMLQEASIDKQIIITTHNPEIVKFANLDDLHLVSRDERGFSVIKQPAQQKQVRIFLDNKIGIAELYTQNLLEVPHAA